MEKNQSLYNEDLAPVPADKRTWNKWNLAALWVGMAVCIPTYMLAAGLIKAGMNWWQALITIMLGNIIVLIPMALNGHAGTKYGIPLPVLLRSSFGVFGTNLPSLMRGLVACGWFGIQTWIGGAAIYGLAGNFFDIKAIDSAALPVLGITALQFLAFMIFWGINVFIIYKGIESIRWLENWAAPFLITVGLGLLAWGVVQGGGFGKIFSADTVNKVRNFEFSFAVSAKEKGVLAKIGQGKDNKAIGAYFFQKLKAQKLTKLTSFKIEPVKGKKQWIINLFTKGTKQAPQKLAMSYRFTQTKKSRFAVYKHNQKESFNFWLIFFPLLTAMIGFWSTLALNIPDFTRYAKDQREQILGQAIGLPTTMTLFSFIGIAVTSATVVVFGEAIWDPVKLLQQFTSPMVVGLSLLGLTIATLSTNIAANVVAPANGFSNLWPSKISFKTGGLITGIIGILIMPWNLLSNLGGYIFTWLIGYSALLGAIAGVMLADYFLLRKAILKVDDLYSTEGEYSFGKRGYNWRAIVALILGILPNIPGFLQAATNKWYIAPAFFNTLYTYAWFVSLFLAGALYLLLMKFFPPKEK